MNDNKMFKKNMRFSKTLKEIDTRLKFKSSQKYLADIKKRINHNKRMKKKFSERMNNHKDIINKLYNIGDDTQESYNNYSHNFKDSLVFTNNPSKINVSSTINNFISLPKLTVIKNEFMDNDKHKYNIIRFESIWKDHQINENKFNQKQKLKEKNQTVYKNDIYVDIFDKNYTGNLNSCEEYKQKNEIFERIKSNNLKVNKRVKIFREIMKKFKDIREYCPNYSVIEKHQPEVKLNTKSKRIFPAQFIKRFIYNEQDIDDFKNNENKNNNKLRKNNSNLNILPSKNNFPIHINKNNNEFGIKRRKKKFFLSTIDYNDTKNKSRINMIRNKNRSVLLDKSNTFNN